MSWPPPEAVPQAVVNPAPGPLNHTGGHTRHRRFIGPLPEVVVFQAIDVVPQTPKRKTWLSSLMHTGVRQEPEESQHEHEEGVRRAIRNHAHQFFLGRGGRSEDWGERTERHAREEMWRIWRDSEWGRARAERKESKTVKRWVGSSFDVGMFLGVDLLRHSPATSPPGTVSGTQAETAPPSTAFVTAPSIPSPPPLEHPRPGWGDSHPASLNELTSRPLHDVRSEPALVTRTPMATPTHDGIRSDGDVSQVPTPPKNKGKTVHYADTATETPVTTGAPAPPAEVLSRTGVQVQETSAGAAQQATLENQVRWGDVILRDRMLVRVSHTDRETIGPNFDENQNRVTPHMQNEKWKEYIVAWRKDQLELHEDHATPGKEWLSGHKHLAFTIPLDSMTTRLSLYSFVDLTFCLICPEKPLQARSKRRWLLFGSSGTSIFVFKVKARTRAVDWVWHLWRHLGGKMPPFVEVRAPFLDTHFRIDIPHYDSADIQAAYSVFTRANITALCEAGLREVPGYNTLIEEEKTLGVSFELAWRLGTYLDWIWQVHDVEDKYRDWAVLCGIALKQHNKPAHLELRIHRHRPNRVHLKDGTRLDEPPAVEGYLQRIRPNTQLKQSLYLVTHDGWMFATTPARAYPPTPPGAPLQTEDIEASPQDIEVCRGRRQIMHATGMTDLRSIVAVRRAFQIIPSSAEPVYRAKFDSEDTEEFWAPPESHEMDGLDPGGDEALYKSTDKASLRMRRSFELLLSSGRVIRFETHSCSDALEWINRLRPLVSYWRKRHRMDAREEMNLAYEAGRSRISPPKFVCAREKTPEHLPSPDAPLPELSVFYNWCVLDECRPILKCGRVFWRLGRKGPYKQLQLVLVSGHLVQFHVTGTPSLHHRRHLTVNLLDAYVCSGYIAAQRLPPGQYHPDTPSLPRRYRDGLESDESDEDTIFMIWYRRHVPSEEMIQAAHPVASTDGTKTMHADVPPLNAKRKLGVYRTRSKLERDAWVWAINVEIDKAVRRTRERETRIRETGKLIMT
ncbi:unnamed protein product [Somion occarium]|uniref:PH domain-containing protein n=1 Tax=Somion occarium TaxID=3059160 RepID=A0ABP1DZB5_9APHY